jgi:hypothetical protein
MDDLCYIMCLVFICVYDSASVYKIVDLCLKEGEWRREVSVKMIPISRAT